MTNTKIVIVGAGFSGLSAALNLSKIFKNNQSIKIILIDSQDYHLFSPHLFEVAASNEELTTIEELKKSAILPVGKILEKSGIEFIKGNLGRIEPSNKKIIIGARVLFYNYLILATGFAADFGQTKGAKEFALPLVNLTDALRVRNAVSFALQSRRMEVKKKTLKFVVVGKGMEDAEFAAKLTKILKFANNKKISLKAKIEIIFSDAESELFGGKYGGLKKDILLRLKKLGINAEFNRYVVQVDKNWVEFLNGEKMEYDLLIWGKKNKGNVKNFGDIFSLDNNSRIKVEESLRAIGYDDIFALGGVASPYKEQTNLEFCSYQDAIKQGEYIAYALPKIMLNQRPIPYEQKNYPLFINLGGNWAIYKSDKYYYKGYFAYLISLYNYFKYYCYLVGWRKAFKYIWFKNKLYGRNN